MTVSCIGMINTLRREAYTTLAAIDQKLERQSPLITILCYHSIARDTWGYSHNPETFKSHLDMFVDEGYVFTDLKTVEQVLKGQVSVEVPSIAVTFDDGYKDIQRIIDVIGNYAITPTLFLLADTQHANRQELGTDRAFLSPSEIRNFHSLGWDIQSHTTTHPDLSKIPVSQLISEIDESKNRIEDITGSEVNSIAYPKGRYTEAVLDAVKKSDFEFGYSTNDGDIDTRTNPLLVPRIVVNRSHSLEEVRALNSRSNVQLRRVLKALRYQRLP